MGRQLESIKGGRRGGRTREGGKEGRKEEGKASLSFPNKLSIITATHYWT